MWLEGYSQKGLITQCEQWLIVIADNLLTAEKNTLRYQMLSYEKSASTKSSLWWDKTGPLNAEIGKVADSCQVS